VTDKTGFSFDMPVKPANPFKPLPTRAAFDLCRAYPAQDGSLLLHNTRNGKRAMVRPEVYASLLLCSQFKTLKEHTEAIIARNPGMQGQQADIRKVLKNMLDIGIMVSAKSACDELKKNINKDAGERPGDAPVVAILTWERPQALERLLESIAANCDTGSFHHLFVIDDSRKAENISQNKVIASRYDSVVSCDLRYFGQSEQQSFIDEMVKQIPDQADDIRFLTDQCRWKDHWTAGLSRNLALLLSCGRRLVMMDDDAVCSVHNPPGQKSDITFSDEPREATFFGNEQEWAHLQQPINPDPVNRHMQCLGLTFSEALAALGENHLKPGGLASATALQLSELQQDSAILVTECGSLGCPGTARNTWLPNMAPASLKRMLASGDKTTQALSSRKVWSGRSQPHFAPRSNMSQITGFDNRRVLPPYLPILRGQDRLFGSMLDFVYPTSVVLDYPWAVPHLPLPERKWRDRDLNFTPADSFPRFIVEKIVESKTSCQSSSPADRMTALSAWFYDLGTASDSTLKSLYIDNRLRDDSERLQQLSKLLAKAESTPVNWQNYLRNGITQLNADLDKVSREGFEPGSGPATPESGAAVTFWKTVWCEFSSVLKSWPQIRQAAARVVSTL